MRLFSLLNLAFWLCACQPPTTTDSTPSDTYLTLIDTITEEKKGISIAPLDYDSTEWLELTYLDKSIRLDMKYATTDNFVGKVLYQCPRCFLRPEAARALVAVHKSLQLEGLGLKLFDCYRPRDIQWKLWEIYPKPGYVANPRTGSIHNRGTAIDLTIVDQEGNELDMGTSFDFFGVEAHHSYSQLSQQVLNNRIKLKKIMQQHGFSAIRREWWHYNYGSHRHPLSDEEWDCL